MTWVNIGPSTSGHPQMEGSVPRGMAEASSDPDPHGQLLTGTQAGLADAESDLSCRP